VLNALARGDPSVALVASMHPAVLSFWHASPDAPPQHRDAWSEQRAYVSRMAAEGCWFGTITSEPGSGGDVARTAAAAEAGQDGGWRISGKKHFGSGSGITSFMLTSARAVGEDEPDEEDVRALGYLRPPWGLAYDAVIGAMLCDRHSSWP
jgi:alkylation response protein AidB-like acyl-CoA dehydrogenase